MAVPFSYIILSSVVFLALQHVATGLTCYLCDDCNTVNNSTPIDTSNAVEFSCWKTIILAATVVTRTNRGVMANCKEVDSVIGGTGMRTTCCSKDRCNSGIPLSNSIGLSIFLIMAGSIIQFVLMH
ncbi:unnamed protein product [Rotaria magnacalcarata]|uniref:Snake toxin/toxin-like domain-containing protein n=1 Tax=Rotaria magnacalcarata TaxID=392030 RepID=A0A819C4T8_9BILA|nr:unnamed protein product [Rotaria magnacalcarata]CAF3801876.1 unnamed protein product [Rotaria magnacalcarata]